MLRLVLCCCELQVLQEYSAGDSILCRPAISSLPTDSILCRWPYHTAGGNFSQPVVILSVQGSSPEVLTASRGVKEGKQRQPMHGGALPEAFSCFN
ncbi:hypothetical protein CsSME_00017813 [Camellia sinensis var. sinensis]